MKLYPCLSSCANVSSKGIKVLEVRNFETTVGKRKKNTSNIHKGDNFLKRTLIAQEIPARIGKRGCNRLKGTAQETITRVKSQPEE